MRCFQAVRVLLVLAILAPSASAAAVGPIPEGTMRLGFAADAQAAGDRQPFRDVISRFSETGVSRILYGGDTSYGYKDAPPDWVDALGPYAEDERFLMVLGNHDKPGPGHLAFTPDGEGWWVEDLGGVVVIGIETSARLGPGSEQEAWLVDQLQQHEESFVILMMHIPWWLSITHHTLPGEVFPNDAGRFDQLVEKHDVDLVLGGHVHYYARHERMNATFLLTGPADAGVRRIPDEVAREAAFTLSEPTSTILDLSACGARAIVLDEQGRAVDQFEAAAIPADAHETRSLNDRLACLPGLAVPQRQAVAAHAAGRSVVGEVVGRHLSVEQRVLKLDVSEGVTDSLEMALTDEVAARLQAAYDADGGGALDRSEVARLEADLLATLVRQPWPTLLADGEASEQRWVDGARLLTRGVEDKQGVQGIQVERREVLMLGPQGDHRLVVPRLNENADAVWEIHVPNGSVEIRSGFEVLMQGAGWIRGRPTGAAVELEWTVAPADFAIPAGSRAATLEENMPNLPLPGLLLAIVLALAASWRFRRRA